MTIVFLKCDLKNALFILINAFIFLVSFKYELISVYTIDIASKYSDEIHELTQRVFTSINRLPHTRSLPKPLGLRSSRLRLWSKAQDSYRFRWKNSPDWQRLIIRRLFLRIPTKRLDICPLVRRPPMMMLLV